MNTQDKINALYNKFSASVLETIVNMEFKRTYDIRELSSEEIEVIYKRFFPEKSTFDSQFKKEQDDELKRLKSVILKEAQFIGIYTPESWVTFNRLCSIKASLKRL
ncbi:hypothetical protein BWK59_13925 [Flavobacterium davisii]|uniref:Uncharacterized protein n=1 Tax=Flavobacterium davisii TaxID=2906077 RepID=A0A246GFA2_9FLAO|nr:hypothetical protein [Flavobacterium davisii]OWP82800.1 hypothetical protein BWK59_13925 [Flavobacterium davisii]